MTGSNSVWYCLDGSMKLDSDGELIPIGTYKYPDDIVKQYQQQEVNMEAGGM